MASKLVKTSTIISMDEEGASSGITSGQERYRNFLNASWVQAILGFVPTKYSTNFDISPAHSKPQRQDHARLKQDPDARQKR